MLDYCEVSSIGILHQNAESITELFEESAFIGDDVGRIDGSQKSNFIESIIFFSGVELHHFDLFHGVNLIIFSVLAYLDDSTEAAGT